MDADFISGLFNAFMTSLSLGIVIGAAMALAQLIAKHLKSQPSDLVFKSKENGKRLVITAEMLETKSSEEIEKIIAEAFDFDLDEEINKTAEKEPVP